jgi:L-malate glycosyltransferase
MRISFLTPAYMWSPSGGYRIIYEYANRLVSRGHDVTVVHPRRLNFRHRPKPTLRERLRSVKFALFEMVTTPMIDWHPIDSRVRLLFVPSLAERYIPDADVVFATAWQTARAVMECSAAKGVKCHLIQGYETWMGPEELVHESWRAPTKKVVVSKWLFELGESLGAGSLTYVPNAIDTDVYRLTQPISQRTRQVVMVCSTVKWKGSRDGVKALELARKAFPDLKATFFGNSRRPTWVPSWITYQKNPPQDRIVKDYYNAASIVLSPSLSEGFALPPAEGAACGCAIVATDSGGIRDFAEHGVTALLSSPGDPEALAKNLCSLLGDDALRIRLAQAANQRIKQFTWDRSANLLENFITSAVQCKFRERPLSSVADDHSLTIPIQAEGD